MLIFVSGSNGSDFPSVHLSSQRSAVAIYLNKARNCYMKLAILIIILDFDWLHILLDIYIYFYPENTIDDFMELYCTEVLMEVFLQNFICFMTMLKIWLKSRRLGLVCMVSRVENQFAMSLIYSKLDIPRCSLLQNILKPCCKSITVASIQKAKRLNSKINFVEKGKQPCS